MATMNPFDLLGDDAEDPSHLIAAEQLKAAEAAAAAAAAPKKAPAQQNKPAQLPTKPPPPAQAVKESRNEPVRGGRGGGRGAGRGFGRGRGFSRDSPNDENSFPAAGAPYNQGSVEEGDGGRSSERRGYGGPRGPYRGGRRGGFSNGETVESEEGRPRRAYDRRSGTGRGNEFKREGAGRGNWGTQNDDITETTEEVVNETEKNLGDEKPAVEEVADGNKDSPANETEEKEPEDKEMTLEEYEKVLEERRKAFQALKTEGRKVDAKEFETMQPLSSKKTNHDIFIKLGSDKDKRKEALEKEEKSKKSVSITEFLKPAEGETYYNPGGRGRGRGGRGSRGGYRGGATNNAPAPSIEDPGHFPTLGAK
ncbi:hypothetical protein PHAVU_008G047300 [Phaseolus vulgaris]|uniref:Hyaluronan/mRNA-binding protein domain-containing protein n=1 Tax=Phaseolus vulgaris TaxID=3885 RepID=V7B283_PHAVU|nr:hypothetical protein PHAVU_008G047300g [Phaseolus vulgaris]ESW11640.1 hypothetical protein PHAVU_008G047300g [Phaseolus vulgaris]